MPWIVGIDEAGYGPNLGPFVMSSAAVRVPEKLVESDLWSVLSAGVRRAGDTADGRLTVDDSKAVFSPARGLSQLESNLLPFTALPHESVRPLEDYWHRHCITPLAELEREPWYALGFRVPVNGCGEDWREPHRRFQSTCSDHDVAVGEIRSVAVFPRQFNALVAHHDSKAAVPGWALEQLLHQLPFGTSRSPLRVTVDKLGGRNYYHALLQHIFPDCLVRCRVESARRSTYQLRPARDDLVLSFEPEADARHLPVALASMMSKYVREVLMGMFNRFWQQHVPDLKPTAGYPSDAQRFYRDIEPARKRLGIADETLWRVR